MPEMMSSASTVAAAAAPSAVLAWMHIGRDAGVHYHVKLQGLSSPITRVTIESSLSSSSSSSANKQTTTTKVGRVIEDITADVVVVLPPPPSSSSLVVGGGSSTASAWVNGTVARLRARDLELLYEGELYVNVATQLHPQTEIRGRIVQRLAGEAQRAAIIENGPVLLSLVDSGSGNQQQQQRAALGWVHVDNECNFHYDVTVTTGGASGGWWFSSSSTSGGGSRSRESPISFTVLELIDIPRLSVDVHHHQDYLASSSSGGGGGGGIMLIDGSSNTYGEVQPYLPNIRILEEFAGYQVENMLTDPPLNKLSLARINAGVAYLKLTESPAIGSGAPAGQFQGWLTHVHVPDTCLPYAFKQQQQMNAAAAVAAAGGGEGDEQQQQQRSNDDLLLLEDGGGAVTTATKTRKSRPHRRAGRRTAAVGRRCTTGA